MMSIPVERIGGERQRIPAVLTRIEKQFGVIKYSAHVSVHHRHRLMAPLYNISPLSHTTLRVPLSELQLAPSAFASVPSPTGDESDTIVATSTIPPSFNPRDAVEVWLDDASTTGTHTQSSDNDQLVTKNGSGSKDSAQAPQGAWWPGRVITMQGGFAHVEVFAPQPPDVNGEDCSKAPPHHLLRVGSSMVSCRTTLVKVSELRTPWYGYQATAGSSGKDSPRNNNPSVLTNPGVLHRHTVCIPAYLSHIATSATSHSVLLDFCGAPCLIQCDPEPFLPDALAKRILAECSSAMTSGENKQQQQQQQTVAAAAASAVVLDSSTNCSTWPSPELIAQSSPLTAPTIVGALNPATGVTDPALLLEGLPGASGPLVLLHIWSGSAEAVRRASFLELAHVRMLVFRYHVCRKMSKGELTDLDLPDPTDSSSGAADGDAVPIMHCKPISMPTTTTGGGGGGSMMIGYSGEFRIPPHLVGLVIGRQGATIQEARALPGVRNVQLATNGTIHVQAETVEGCQAVRNLLDFMEAEIPVSPRLASRLIGVKGKNIRQLQASAGVREALLLNPAARLQRQRRTAAERRAENHQSTNGGVSVDLSSSTCPVDSTKLMEAASPIDTESSAYEVEEGDGEHEGGTGEQLPPPAFYLLGTRTAVAKMRLLLEFQAENWNELDELNKTRRDLCSQLRQSSNTPMTRNSSVNSSDGIAMDTPAMMGGRRGGGGPFRGGRGGRGGRPSGRFYGGDGVDNGLHNGRQPPPQITSTTATTTSDCSAADRSHSGDNGVVSSTTNKGAKRQPAREGSIDSSTNKNNNDNTESQGAAMPPPRSRGGRGGRGQQQQQRKPLISKA